LNAHLNVAELLELRVQVPQNELAYSRSHLTFLYFYLTSHSAGGVQVLQKAWNILSEDAQANFRIAEFNLDALNTVDLGPRRHFSVGECALWARFTGPNFAAQVEAVVCLVEEPYNCGKAAAMPTEVMAIKYINTTKHSIKMFSSHSSPANTQVY
jgi:hypothetical protein